MSPLVVLALSFCAMLAVFAVAYGAMLAFHSPARPAWMNNGWADNTVVIVLVTAAIFAFAWMLNALLALGLDPLLALTLVVAGGISGAWALWRRMHVAERLDAARSGISPFADLRHIRHRQRTGFRDGGYGPGVSGAA